MTASTHIWHFPVNFKAICLLNLVTSNIDSLVFANKIYRYVFNNCFKLSASILYIIWYNKQKYADNRLCQDSTFPAYQRSLSDKINHREQWLQAFHSLGATSIMLVICWPQVHVQFFKTMFVTLWQSKLVTLKFTTQLQRARTFWICT